jgi:hypothetical protein
MRKLDRVLVNEKWNLKFPLLEARFLPSGMSDHSPMVVKVIGNDQNIKNHSDSSICGWIMTSSCPW